MKIVGKQKVDYVSRKTNQPVQGVTLHCTDERQGIEGVSVETIFVSAKSDIYNDVVNIPIGSNISVGYNRWGSVEYVQACK